MKKRHAIFSFCVWLSVLGGTGSAVQDFNDLFEQVKSSAVVVKAHAILTQRVAQDSFGSRLRLRPGIHPVTIGGETLKLGGDIILEVAGQTVQGQESLIRIRNELAGIQEGATIQVVVWRHGRRVVLSCKR